DWPRLAGRAGKMRIVVRQSPSPARRALLAKSASLGRPARPASPALPALVAALAILLAGSACGSRPPDNPQQYAARITAERAAKDAEFQQSNDVVPASRKAEFLPLAYFPI